LRPTRPPPRSTLLPYTTLFRSRRFIRFHRSHATEPLDTLTSLIAVRQLNSSSTQTQRWHAQQLAQDQSQPLFSNHQQSDIHANEIGRAHVGKECRSRCWSDYKK